MGKTWYTSDLHFGHDKDFIWAPRGFKSVIEMNETIIENFNQVVSWDDELWILGDCFLKITPEQGINYLSRLPGKKYIIGGNHDTNERIKAISDCADESIMWSGFAVRQKIGKFSFMLTHYPTLTANFDDGKKHPVINLSGHTHSKDKWQFWPQMIYNVALDAHDNKPVSIDEIIEDIQNKKRR